MAETRSRPMTTRREFVATAAAAFATRYTRWLPRGDHLPLGFSTLGCPAWTWPQILDFAAAHGYVAVELRGLQATMDLSQAPEFAPGRLEDAKRQLTGHGLSVSDLGASAQLHEMDPAKRAAQLAEARRFIDLAQALGAPYVRVFGNNYVKDVPRADMLAHIAGGLRELGDYARPKGVTVLIEALVKIGYRGFYSFEWEKRWHPDIAEPEVAIAQFATVAADYLHGAGVR